MQNRKGWAAFIALVVLLLLSSSSALAGDGRPVIGCFSSGNAALLGMLPAQDPSVRSAFDLGGCLALPPDAASSAPVSAGNVMQMSLMGSPVPFYTPPWGAPSAARQQNEAALQAYAGYVGQSARLLQLGRTYVWCEAAEENFARRWKDFYARWKHYREEGGRMFSDASMMFRRHYSNHGPRLIEEADALQTERAALERKCQPVHEVVLDERFVGFLRSIR